MKNTRIEKIVAEWNKGNFELDLNPNVAAWCRFYESSKEKGFDEIVIGPNDCIFESKIPEMLEAAKELKIEYFVFASGYSSSFDVLNAFVKNGARIGKFVVKTYEDDMFGEVRNKEVPGFRINL